jgi:hypothetical protein
LSDVSGYPAWLLTSIAMTPSVMTVAAHPWKNLHNLQRLHGMMSGPLDVCCEQMLGRHGSNASLSSDEIRHLFD